MIVRAADAVSGVEYALPCEVMWVHPGTSQEPCTIALVVDGIPTRSVFASPDPRMNASISMGQTERLVGLIQDIALAVS